MYRSVVSSSFNSINVLALFQLNNEKAAMESKWAEVRTILLERKGDISRKTSSVESVTGEEQSTVNQLRQMMDTINDLKNTIDKQTKQLELNKVSDVNLRIMRSNKAFNIAVRCTYSARNFNFFLHKRVGVHRSHH